MFIVLVWGLTSCAPIVDVNVLLCVEYKSYAEIAIERSIFIYTTVKCGGSFLTEMVAMDAELFSSR